MKRHWVLPDLSEGDLLTRIAKRRGCASTGEVRHYLEGFYTPPKPCAGQDGLLNQRLAAEKIQSTILRSKPVMVYGDYDVDGITASAVLTEAIRVYGGNARCYIPNRFDEGYGLHSYPLKYFKTLNIDTVITVDCGIRSLEQAELAKELGITLIITDHHQPGEKLPKASVVVNPKQAGDFYPEKSLAGVGLAYKIAQTLLSFKHLPADHLLDLVALGTVADMCPLVGENRDLVRSGLIRLRRGRRTGLALLCQVARVSPPEIDSSAIGFILGPRLNAAGRLDTALTAYNLLTTSDRAEAGRLAKELDTLNRRRQKLTNDMVEHAEITVDREAPVIFAVNASYAPGVVGLVASRLCHRYYRPAIVGHIEDGMVRCSCRSIDGFNITQALDSCADLLGGYGGHAKAAGLTISADNFPAFWERMTALADEGLAGIDLTPRLEIDAVLEATQVNEDLYHELAWIEPTGQENPAPLFLIEGLRVTKRRVSDRFSTFTLLCQGQELPAIAFGDLESSVPVGQLADVVCTLRWKADKGIQLVLQDMRLAGGQAYF